MLFLLSLCSVCDIIAHYIDHYGSWLMVVSVCMFASLKSTVLTALIVCSRRFKVLHVIVWCFTTVFVLLSIVNSVIFALYGFGISRRLVYLILETNPNEVRQFLSVFQTDLWTRICSRAALLGVAVAVLFCSLMFRVSRKFFYTFACVSGVAGIAYMAYIFAVTDRGKSNHLIIFQTARSIYSSVTNFTKMQELLAKRKPLPFAETLVSDYDAVNVAVVIGESASRNHHSLYGYPLQTTPFLDSLRDSLYIFTDAVASSPTTSENLLRILTFMNSAPNQNEWFEYPTIFNVFKSLGYTTAWFSNQERTGSWSNLSGILSADADSVKYLGNYDSEDFLQYRFDDVLLPNFDTFISSGDSLKFVFLHLLGSHFAYGERYPANRGKFNEDVVLRNAHHRPWIDGKRAGIIAEYDNSIRFTDSIIGKVISVLSSSDKPSVMIYLSDHGENVYDDGDYRGRDFTSKDVPFIVYLNEAYKVANPEKASMLAKAVDRPFSTADLIHTIISLTGSYYEWYDPTRDLLSPEFTAYPRYFDGMEIK